MKEEHEKQSVQELPPPAPPRPCIEQACNSRWTQKQHAPSPNASTPNPNLPTCIGHSSMCLKMDETTTRATTTATTNDGELKLKHEETEQATHSVFTPQPTRQTDQSPHEPFKTNNNTHPTQRTSLSSFRVPCRARPPPAPFLPGAVGAPLPSEPPPPAPSNDRSL